MNRRYIPAFIAVLFLTSALGNTLSHLHADDTPSLTVSKNLPGSWLLGPTVVQDKDGAIRLAHSVLLADEMGNTDHHQVERLDERTQAKKLFILEDSQASFAEVLLYRSAATLRWNGTELPLEKLSSTGWMRAQVPTKLLRKGVNEVVLSGRGRLAFEPGRSAGRSLKSSDGGKTWSEQRLGPQANQTGEYLVRLRLGQSATTGWAMSPVFDLWETTPETIAKPGQLVRFPSLPGCWLRTGSTPTPDQRTWTDWMRLDKPYQPDAKLAEHRWAQLRVDLDRTNDNRDVNAFQPGTIQYEWRPDSRISPSSLQVTKQEPAIRSSSVPFTYQEPTPRLKLLRDRYQLDKVIAPGKTEMEKLMLLRYWVRNQWHNAWEGGPASWMPPWDALTILELKDQPECLTMCTHYAAVYTHCCLALGWNARHCILDHHCVSEVWVDELGKWVMMDAGNSKPRPDAGLHYEKDGIPLSALEIHQAYRDGKTDKLRVCFTPKELSEKIAALCRPAPPSKHTTPRPDSITVSDLPDWPVCGIANFRRYGFPDRNNYMTSLLPGEMYQGYSPYAYDGYWWVGDDRDHPTISPEYSKHLSPSRPQDIDWSLNWTRIHLAYSAKPGELQVDLETLTPNLARLERLDEKGVWKQTPARFTWKLQPGDNVLRVRSVNKFDRTGQETRVIVGSSD